MVSKSSGLFAGLLLKRGQNATPGERMQPAAAGGIYVAQGASPGSGCPPSPPSPLPPARERGAEGEVRVAFL